MKNKITEEELIKKIYELIENEGYEVEELHFHNLRVKKSMPTFDDAIERISDKFGFGKENTIFLLKTIRKHHTGAFISMILKELSVMIDKNYENHIRDCEFVYAISVLNGKVMKLHKSQITTYKTIAAFRSLEDAEYAKSVLSEFAELFDEEQ